MLAFRMESIKFSLKMLKFYIVISSEFLSYFSMSTAADLSCALIWCGDAAADALQCFIRVDGPCVVRKGYAGGCLRDAGTAVDCDTYLDGLHRSDSSLNATAASSPVSAAARFCLTRVRTAVDEPGYYYLDKVLQISVNSQTHS